VERKLHIHALERQQRPSPGTEFLKVRLHSGILPFLAIFIEFLANSGQLDTQTRQFSARFRSPTGDILLRNRLAEETRP
jgi:hypothetical protein